MRVADRMRTTIVVEVVRFESPPEFRIEATETREFVLNSFLIVDGRGTPVWEFVRNEFEPVEDAQLVSAVFEVDVLSDAFREALQAASWTEPRRKAAPVHEVRYGSVPPGYKQTIPAEGLPTLQPGNAYRAVIFSSLGGASTGFDLRS